MLTVSHQLVSHVKAALTLKMVNALLTLLAILIIPVHIAVRLWVISWCQLPTPVAIVLNVPISQIAFSAVQTTLTTVSFAAKVSSQS